ncbi:hypothetical protein [Streptomyces sp. CRN 30]|nr:hypothetical protein [Streptomyces sp. CRN 30]
MRRTTVQKPLSRKGTESRRAREENRERPAGRPEIREDIARTWWPEG